MSTLKKLHTLGLKSSEYEVKIVDDSSFDYSDDELWQELKKDSSKSYRALKKREFDLRHN